MSPFFANYGFHPRMGMEFPVSPPKDEPAANFVRRLLEIHQRLQEEMHYAQAKYEDSANRRRTPAPRYQVGDEVWLSSKNITTRRPTKKLDSLWLGPYPIVQVVSPLVYKLELPSTMRMRPVFHTNLLRPAATDPLTGQRPENPGPVIVDNQVVYRVDEILDSRRHYGHIQYLVKWSGWDIKDATWEPIEHVDGLDAQKEFHESYPDKPAPAPALRRSARRSSRLERGG
ncbi:hypothetical protein VTN96DRAFT_4419 [Rasamsonia emersonii]